MGKALSIEIGTKISRLTVVSKEPSKKGHTMVKCLCDCGNFTIVRISALFSNNTFSCGCLNTETTERIFSENRTTHGDTIGGKRSSEYDSYNHMKGRCYTKTNAKFPNYGARGIIVCDRWLGDCGFKNFLSDMGRKPSKEYTIERKDNDGNYEPINCIWATDDIQAANKTTTVRLIIDGKEIHQSGLARLLGVTPHAIEYHVGKGKTGDGIVNYYKQKKNVNTSRPIASQI